MRTSKLGRIAAITLVPVIVAMQQGCSAVPKAVYDFDDGTTQGWQITAVFDEKGTPYTPFFPLTHFEAAQYPDKFPAGDPLNDKNGCLAVQGGQMGPWAKQAGFPDTAQYWEVTVYYTGLNAWSSTAWQKLKGVKVTLGDVFSIPPGEVKANVGVRARIAGKDTEIAERNAAGQPVFHSINHQSAGKWTHLDAKLDVPANADVYQVWVRFRGDWKALYEGALLIDQVTAVK